jgi:hypothetical protein
VGEFIPMAAGREEAPGEVRNGEQDQRVEVVAVVRFRKRRIAVT